MSLRVAVQMDPLESINISGDSTYPTQPSHPDAALVQVYDASRVNATVLGWGGPRGLATDGDLALGYLGGPKLGIYGQNPEFVALGKPMRAGDLLSREDPHYTSSIPVGPGDSGAPVLLQEGRLAVGIHTGAPTNTAATERGVLLEDAIAFFAQDPQYAGLQLARG